MKIDKLTTILKRKEGEKGVDWGILAAEPGKNAIEWFLQQKGFFPHRLLALLIGSLSISMVIIFLFCGTMGALEVRILRSTSLSFFLILAFLMNPLGRKSWKDPYNIYFIIDIVLVLSTLVIQVYTFVNIDRFTWKIGVLSFWEEVFGVILLFLILEAARRTMGLIFCLICLFFLIEPLFSKYLPGILHGPPIDFEQVVEQQFMRDDGIFGIALGVMVSTLSVFLVFAAYLQKTHASQFFISLGLSIAGKFRGGAAKVAILSSGFMGSISGSVVANVATTGSVTIPMMKRIGYSGKFSGAVEAVASSGGQLMPPIMGIAAFLIAAITGIPYFEVCKRALLPAILYFFSVFLVVDLRARKLGLSPLDKADIPSFINVVRDGGFLAIPILIILYLLVKGYSPEKAIIISLLVIFILSFIRPQTRLSPVKLLDAVEEGGRIMVPIGIACASVGIIIGSLGASGLGTRFTSFVSLASGGHLWLALLYSMVAAIVLGMGVPTSIVYVFLAVLIVPALIKMGVIVMAAHLFAFYFGVIGNITPPFALGSFAAAAISGASPMGTAFSGVRIALACFIIPFIFAYEPALLLTGSIFKIVVTFFTTIIGIWALASSTEGFLFRKATIIERILLFITALVLIKPGLRTDLLGLALFCVVVIIQKVTTYETLSINFGKKFKLKNFKFRRN